MDTKSGGTTATVSAAIGRELRAFRRRADLTQEEMAARLRNRSGDGPMYAGQYRRYESGERDIPVDLVVEFAVALGVNPGDIWDEARKHSPGVFDAQPQQPAPTNLDISRLSDHDRRLLLAQLREMTSGDSPSG